LICEECKTTPEGIEMVLDELSTTCYSAANGIPGCKNYMRGDSTKCAICWNNLPAVNNACKVDPFCTTYNDYG